MNDGGTHAGLCAKQVGEVALQADGPLQQRLQGLVEGALDGGAIDVWAGAALSHGKPGRERAVQLAMNARARALQRILLVDR